MTPEQRAVAGRQAVNTRWERARAADAAPIDAARKARLHGALDRLLDILEGGQEPNAHDIAVMRDIQRTLNRIARRKGR
jgi:hypothetical protein